MKTKIISGLLFACTLVSAQPYVHQVIFLNEGHYDYINGVQTVPVTIGVYSPVSQTYWVIDTVLNARFGSDVIVDGNSFYVAADSFLLKYDATTYQLQNSTTVSGIRKLAIWNNYLLVSRGDVMPLKSYFQVFDKNSLNFIYELDTVMGPKYSAEGIAVYNDSAYLAVNNAFSWGNEKGLLGIVDLANQNYITEIDLGPDGKNPDNVMQNGNMIYTLNNKDWSGSSVSSFNANNRSVSTVNVAISSGCGTSVHALNYVYYQEYSLNKLARFDVNSQSVFDTLQGTLSYYGLLNDTINNVLYATSTDYVSYGKAYILQYNGIPVDSFPVGVSPGNMALDVRNTTSVDNEESDTFTVFPNPVVNELVVKGICGEDKEIMVYNLLGERKLALKSRGEIRINVSLFPSGFYIIKVGNKSQKFIKR